MPVETFGFINSLNSSNPPQTDGLVQGDDHLRGIKATLLAQFPSLTGAVTATQAQLNQTATGIYTLAAGSTGSPSLMFVDSATAFFKKAAGLIGFNGTLRGKGAVAVGSLHMFPKLPGGSQIATASTPGTTFEYLECNGALYLVADYPDLAAFYGATFGGDGVTNFGVPPMTDTGRFPRSRTGSLAVGTAQANALKTHTHTASTGSAGDHTHTFTGTQINLGTLSSTNTFIRANGTGTPGGAGGVADDATGENVQIVIPAFTPAGTNSTTGAHTHTVTVDATGDTETRPEALAVIFAVKS